MDTNDTNTLPLTDMEAALLRSRGYEQPRVRKAGKQFVAIAIKGPFRAEALGFTQDDAARKLINVIVRK